MSITYMEFVQAFTEFMTLKVGSKGREKAHKRTYVFKTIFTTVEEHPKHYPKSWYISDKI